MEILAQVQDALDFIHSVDVSHIDDQLLARRAFYDSLAPLAGQVEAVWQVDDTMTDTQIKLRIYRPADTPILPAVVFFHGGGFNSGSLVSHDRPLRQLANSSGVIIIAVDYRLAPEYPFPGGLNDCMAATRWVFDHATELGIEPLRIGVAGDSAGGTLATAVGGKIPGLKCQVLIYPAIDPALDTGSWKAFANGPVITLERMRKIWAEYAAGNKQAAPVFEKDLSGMPDTFVIMGEYDPLVDEGKAYAEKLRQGYVQVTEKVYPKMIHGFFQMGGVMAQGQAVIKEIAGYLRYKLELIS
ncbi:alpha/beta hydrolase [Chitinophaga sancti]|uniref:Acetyl esterase n=1 Tax=Chitinophaga sancti TaxID=1004 RepID=A0A1K1MW02_9BACT|nr:alpha/beta hydrolase [Chitinophaga sancti]WQD63041.1 alpha/beta hydrolase [Chitinophaga sancti]WQG91334.1 alpha/beta hydrolase [Chitinophaga sancti]SFW27354.1 acetyl esterase [Chitinophaga sancti]